VARNSLLYATATASWGTDRVDQLNLPLSGSYTPEFSGCGVDVYVADTGLATNAADFADTGNVRDNKLKNRPFPSTAYILGGSD